MTTDEATHAYIDALPDYYQVPLKPGYAINKEYLTALTDELHLFIANVVASLIDAGSERDAVMENVALRDAIHNELDGWTNDPKNNLTFGP